jgi:hypothetical protein
MTRKSPFPKYTHNYRDRHGTLRSDFRRGAVNLPLPSPLLGPEYWEAYRDALADFVAGREPAARSQIGAERTKPGTVAAAFVAYTGSATFRNGLSTSTQRVHFNILRRLRDQYGQHRLKHLQRRHIAGWVEKRADMPAAAQVFLKVLRRLMRYLVELGEIEVDPTAGVRPPRQHTAGIHTWSEDEIEQYREYHPVGSAARLALELLLGTAQRRSDVVRMGRQHLRDGGGAIYVKQVKTGAELEIPIGGELAQALAALPAGNLSFLVTEAGAPASATSFAIGATRPGCRANAHHTACARRPADVSPRPAAPCTRSPPSAVMSVWPRSSATPRRSIRLAWRERRGPKPEQKLANP